ncbi:MAG: hypothetical protein HC805_02455, partial [Alkalinema sp. RL_2_19]|nr:hypothetical protein [Alkalinema sp. RL_2_19]
MQMQNSFFDQSLDQEAIKDRILALEDGKVGFYSIGLYPGSLAYNCAMQTSGSQYLLLATRPGRELMGAFSGEALQGMDSDHVATMKKMVFHEADTEIVPNTLEYLLQNCELV